MTTPMFSETLPSFLTGADVDVCIGLVNQAVAFCPGDPALLAFLGSISGSLSAADAVTAAQTWGSSGGATAGYAPPVEIIFTAYTNGSAAYWSDGATAAGALANQHLLNEQMRARSEQIDGWQRAQGISAS